MKEYAIKMKLEELLSLSGENEWIEFKQAKDNLSFDKIGKYFSALSNEANLKGKSCGWLIFGIEDKKRKIVGTSFRKNRANLDSLKHEIAQHVNTGVTFIEIYELQTQEGRVIMFQIPPAPRGIPTDWKGHFYGRDGESLVALNLNKIERIRNQVRQFDWSAQVCQGATIDDLDPQAIKRARIEYKNKNFALAEEVDRWDDITFLNKAKVTIAGNITRTAIILLGRGESEHYISPSVAKISWILKDEKNIDKDYRHFGPPFILTTDLVYNKIRNLTYRYLQNNTLFPTEISQYEPFVIREALNNCIAHQNYELCGKINVIEMPDQLIFTNLGSFIPGSVEAIITSKSPPEYYRNQWLANAMVNLGMIDTIGSGIRRMYDFQRKRYFPLPDYNLGDPQKVEVTIYGKVLDEKYTNMLINITDLDLMSVIYLDKVQKKKRLTKEEARILRKQKLVEGRYPNLYVSAKIATITGDKSGYTKYRAFDDKCYRDLIVLYLKEHSYASKQDIMGLLINKISDILNENQKKNKVRNLVGSMSRNNIIRNEGTRRKPKWVLVEDNYC